MDILNRQNFIRCVVDVCALVKLAEQECELHVVKFPIPHVVPLAGK